MALTTMEPSKAEVARAVDGTGLRDEILRIIRHAASNSERSLQRAIGPSQVGTKCHRKLAFEMSDVPKGRDTTDPLASILGTAYHDWLAEKFARANPPPPAPPIWLLENRVDVGFGLYGSSDVLHVPSGTVIDWKLLGNTTFAEYTKISDEFPDGNPSVDYRIQGHCYGLGFSRKINPETLKPYQVNKVAIAFFGRSKRLSDLHIWSEPWDPTIALKALKRRGLLQAWLDRGNHPLSVGAVPGGACHWCDFKSIKPGDGLCEEKK